MIWLETSFCLLSVPFTNALTVDEDMLAALLRAIQHVANDGLRTIRWKQNTILFEIKDNLLVVLIMRSVSDEPVYRKALNATIERIRERFLEHTLWSQLIRNGQVQSSRECVLDVVRLFPIRLIDERLTPLLRSCTKKFNFDFGEFKLVRESIMSYIDGKRTVQQIIDASGFDAATVSGVISVLWTFNHIDLFKIPCEHDALKVVNRPNSTFFISHLPFDRIDEIVHDFDGVTEIRQIAVRHSIDTSVVLFIAKELLKQGVLSY